MKAFIAVILNMGIVRKPTIPEYWNRRDKTQATPWFRQMFSRNRFQLILKFFHVVDNLKIPGRQSQLYKPDLKFKPLLDFANRMFQHYYTPSRNLSIDETLVATRGKTSMLQYIPTKRAKFGVKFWVLADSLNGYVQKMTCYLGKRFEPAIVGLQGTRVVLDLLSNCNLLNKGYHVVVDGFFCSIDLAKRLLQVGTYVTGTLRANRPMPITIKNARLDSGETIYMRQGEILITAYRPANRARAKPVRLLSTAIAARDIHDRCPAIVHTYNHYMGGVDGADMLLSFYNGQRKTIKVWKKMAFNIIQRMALNSYVLYSQNTQENPMSRLRYMQAVVSGLSEEHLRERNQPPVVVRRERHRHQELRLVAGGREKDCAVCSNRRMARRRSRKECSVCLRGCHRVCWQNHVLSCKRHEE
ncbi:piggyBac transposable element-derived protein 4-like [Mercenaria mercenaria]|uniref:piggyBac transposable element-derived protein 4-like n=2 Tax=Mercenaria mercenaria TaxID=6596 RepID=UPI001E1DCA42|nr:piggyBac transposable element-derived protein 4-like [Mercenaria mercenaria]